MKTVRDACQLQPNALSIKLSDQIEQLDELIHAEGDGSVFFEKTFITQGMRDLITKGIARLAGVSTQAVFHLKQAMGGGKTHINRALDNARKELGRAERNITPVDLAANEIYDILRKRLFKSRPDTAEIDDIADAYGKKLEEASKAKVVNRGAEAIADEIAATYPFHPRLKNVIALFKENEQFKQTRGLIELVSRLLRSVWDRQANDVFLIGP